MEEDFDAAILTCGELTEALKKLAAKKSKTIHVSTVPWFSMDTAPTGAMIWVATYNCERVPIRASLEAQVTPPTLAYLDPRRVLTDSYHIPMDYLDRDDVIRLWSPTPYCSADQIQTGFRGGNYNR